MLSIINDSCHLCISILCFCILIYLFLYLLDYATGFGGKYGVQKDRVDKVSNTGICFFCIYFS